MTELTLEKVMEAHDAIILRYGGANGILCLGTVDYLVDQINDELDPFKKASLALNIVITCHPFMDGNKRTAFQLAELILSENGYHIQADIGEKVRALTRIAEYCFRRFNFDHPYLRKRRFVLTPPKNESPLSPSN